MNVSFESLYGGQFAVPPNRKSNADLKESLIEEILLQTCPSNQTKLSFNDF